MFFFRWGFMDHRFGSARSVSAALVVIAALGACTKLTEYTASTNRYGSVNIKGKSTSTSEARAAASAFFFEAVIAAVPNSARQQDDQCVFTALDTNPPAVPNSARAGASLALTTGATSVTLPFEDLNFRYATPVAQPFTYRAGDMAQVTVPGNGDVYPASSISVKLAEPLLPGAVTLPAANQPLVISWNATNDTTSAILLSLRYARPASSTNANEQIFCSVKDDGRYDIPAAALASFLASPASLRSLQLTRFRTNESRLDGRTLLHIATTVDTIVKFP